MKKRSKVLDLIDSAFTEDDADYEEIYRDLVDEFADIHEQYASSRLWENKAKWRVYLAIERPHEALQLTGYIDDGCPVYSATKIDDGEVVASASADTLTKALANLSKPAPKPVPHNERNTPGPSVKIKPKAPPKSIGKSVKPAARNLRRR
jgi:hypothetical protein